MPSEVNRVIRNSIGKDLRVDMQLDGPLDRLPADVDLSAYRIVQEALTNARKYATDRTASVRVISTPAALTIHSANRSSPDVR